MTDHQNQFISWITYFLTF